MKKLIERLRKEAKEARDHFNEKRAELEAGQDAMHDIECANLEGSADSLEHALSMAEQAEKGTLE